MSNQDGGGPEIKYLPDDDAVVAAKKCGQELRHINQFEKLSVGEGLSDQYGIWVDNDSLVEISAALVASFQSLIETSRAEIRITAIRFEQQTSVPMKERSSVYLIPVYTESDDKLPLIANKQLAVGQYMHLTETAKVDPGQGFICILLLSQSQ